MKFKCEICDEGECYETIDLYSMIAHLENHCKVLAKLIDKMLDMSKKEREKLKLNEDIPHHEEDFEDNLNAGETFDD